MDDYNETTICIKGTLTSAANALPAHRVTNKEAIAINYQLQMQTFGPLMHDAWGRRLILTNHQHHAAVRVD